MISELEAVIASIDRMSEQARRELTIAATPVMAASILPGICRDFSNTHPHVRLHVKDVGRKEILSLVESGEADLGLGAFFKPASGIARKRIGRFRLVYLTAASTGAYERAEEAKPSEIPWAMLPDEPLISLPSDNPIQQIIDGCLRDVGRSIEQRDICNNLLTFIALVEAGYGSAILPSFVLPMCERFQVKCQTLRSPVAPIDFFMVTKRDATRQILSQFLPTLFRRQ
jgi:DNA-binding transcriptional LysR family regulator